MTGMLLKTKLFAPPLRNNAIPRARLLERLGQPAPRQLTLIHAPAGYGKTTLALQWLQTRQLDYAWLSLDAQDNDPLRFWRYVSGALGKVGEPSPALGDADPEALIVALVNHWSDRTTTSPTVLVLDDFHVIQDAALLDSINWFLDNLPASLHVLITARVLPSLHIPLRRVRNTLTEIRADDLSFERAECQRFFRDTLQLAVNARMLDTLQAKTEGWAAALQLAGLSLRQQPDPSPDWLEQQSSTLLVDYLAEEVLASLPEATRHFLLTMAIVRRFNLALCCSMSDDDDSDTIEALLEALREDNLFLIPLDDHGQWFRFHDLFRENLLNLARQQWPDRWDELHRRAARWFVQEQDREEAIHCLLGGELWHEAADLIEQLGVTRMLAGQNESLNWWLTRLPTDILLQRPKLALIKAWTLFCTERVIDAEPYLDQADQLLQADHPDNSPLRTQIAIFRTQLARVRGDEKQAHHWSEQARALAAATGNQLNAVARFALGMELYQDGNHNAARQTLNLALQAARQERNHFCALTSAAMLAHVLFQQGMTRLALDTLAQTRTWLLDEGLDAHYVACWQNSVYVHIYCETGRLEEAHAAMQALLNYRNAGAEAAYAALITVMQATIDAAESNFPAALKALDAVETVLERDRSQWSVMGPSIGMLRTLYRLQSGQIAPALRWAVSRERSLLASIGFRLEEDRIVLARCLALQQRSAEGLALLERIEADSALAGRLINQVKAMVARALILAPQDQDAAAACLLQALQKAEEPGYRRLFLDEGDALHPLFNRLVQQGHSGWWDGALAAAAPVGGLIEPLTARELEVLDMIAQGHRNQSIADALHIAVTTTKAHIRNIYEKMAVNSRTQAVARARELGLLP